MVPITSLVIPILVSAVFAFLASSVIHMVLRYHKNDFQQLPNEDSTLEAMRQMKIPPGDYCAPFAGSTEALKSPAFAEKAARGPLVLMTVSPGAAINMGPQLVQWFVYCVAVSFFTAYITSRVLGPDAHYLEVFRVAGTVTFMAYALALPQYSIWYKRNWGTTLRSMLDGLIYALLTAGTFGWLW
jgi:hypothetical protein